MNKQEFFRRQYRELRPDWRDSLVIYRDCVVDALRPESSLLDLGCGHADFMQPAYERAQKVVGLDPDLHALMRNLTVDARVCGVAEQIPFQSNSFDLVTAAWVLEHLDVPVAAFREAHRVLRPGGALIFLTPNAWNYNVWVIRAIPNRFHDMLVRRLYRRQERDTFPVRYRVNSVRSLRQVAKRAHMVEAQLILNGDPSYISFNRYLFKLARGIEWLLDRGPLRNARVHIIGVYRKPDSE